MRNTSVAAPFGVIRHTRPRPVVPSPVQRLPWRSNTTPFVPDTPGHERARRVHVGGGQLPDHPTLIPISDVEAALAVAGDPGGAAPGWDVAYRADLEDRAARIDLPERTPSFRRRSAAGRIKIPMVVARQPFDRERGNRERLEARIVRELFVGRDDRG